MIIYDAYPCRNISLKYIRIYTNHLRCSNNCHCLWIRNIHQTNEWILTYLTNKHINKLHQSKRLLSDKLRAITAIRLSHRSFHYFFLHSYSNRLLKSQGKLWTRLMRQLLHNNKNKVQVILKHEWVWTKRSRLQRKTFVSLPLGCTGCCVQSKVTVACTKY